MHPSECRMRPAEVLEVTACRKKKARRSVSTTDWQLEFSLPNVETTFRTQVFEALHSECAALLVCVRERRELTLPEGSAAIRVHTLTREQVVRSADCYACARFKQEAEKDYVVDLVHRCLPARVTFRVARPIASWGAKVEEISRIDIEAAMKCIDETALDWRTQLWLKIVYDGVRSVRSFDPIFRVLASKHLGVSSVFNQLLNRYYQQQNYGSARRVVFSRCYDPKALDLGIRNDAPWTHSVLDWFAGRLVPTNINRCSLYLWGRAGSGKTRFVNRLLEAQMCLCRDCSEPFFLQGLCEDHDFVWLDEFVPDIVIKNKEYRQQFNKLAGRERVAVRVKGGQQYEVDAGRIRTIVTSNEPPWTADHFMRRFFIVEAKEGIYDTIPQGKSCPPAMAVHPRLVLPDNVVTLDDGDSGHKWRVWNIT